MNALLGTEVPHTTAINQTSIPQAFVDPPTDLVKITPNDNMVPVTGTLPDGTQLWKITHNGVDSHAVHFHLFHVQLVNRVGWDGAIYPPEANELGWKDTVLMHPLSDVIVAMRPMVMKGLPFKVPNSHRLLDPALAAHAISGDFFNFNPLNGNASNVTNEQVNYGWEYLWHCHILGHEENDMMRTIAVAQPPEAPINLTATTTGTGNNQRVRLDWKDNSVISNWVTIQRSTTSAFTAGTITEINVVEPECAVQAGCARTYTDNPTANTSVYYRVMANNTVGAGDGKLDTPRNPDGSYGASLLDIPTAPNSAPVASLTPGFAGYANVTANSDFSNTAARPVPMPIAVVSPANLAFGTVTANNSKVLPATLTNTGTLALTISTGNNSRIRITGNNANQFSVGNNPCGSSLAANGATCTINVTFTPTSAGAKTATLTITDNSNNLANSTQTVILSGTGVVLPPTATLDVSTLTFPDTMVTIPSAAQTVTLKNTGSSTLTVNRAMAFTGPFARSGGTCSTGNGTFNLGAGASCTVGVTFTPTATGAASGSLGITNTGNNGATAGTQTVNLSGNGIPLVVTANPDSVTMAAPGGNGTQTVTVDVRANDIPTTGTVAFVSLSKTAGNGTASISNNLIVLSLPASGNNSNARAAVRRGVYTVTFSLTANGTTVQSTATITLN
jgi:hypothetical protein